MLLGQFLQPLANPPLFVVDACFIPLRRAWLLHQPASVSFRVAPFAAQILHRPSSARRASQFFRLMSSTAPLSKCCSATLFFTRPFSFSISFSRPRSAPSIPPSTPPPL